MTKKKNRNLKIPIVLNKIKSILMVLMKIRDQKNLNMNDLIHMDLKKNKNQNNSQVIKFIQNKSKLLKSNLKTPKKMSQEIIEQMKAKKNNQKINLKDSE